MSDWYYCGNCNPPIFLRHPTNPPPCNICRGATALAHDVVRFTAPGAGGYEIRWHTRSAAGSIIERPMLKVVTTVGGREYSVLLEDEVLSYDTPAASISKDTALSPPGGGRWTDNNVRNHSGGVQGSIRPAVPAALGAPALRIGNHGSGNQHGLVHIMHRHINMFGDMRARPAAEFNLANFRDNLRSMTGPPTGRGEGICQIATQQNNNIAVHGIANTIRSMLVIDPNGGSHIKTCWAEQNRLGGLGQNPTIIRRWR